MQNANMIKEHATLLPFFFSRGQPLWFDGAVALAVTAADAAANAAAATAGSAYNYRNAFLFAVVRGEPPLWQKTRATQPLESG